jgi:hypothetical protein
VWFYDSVVLYILKHFSWNFKKHVKQFMWDRKTALSSGFSGKHAGYTGVKQPITWLHRDVFVIISFAIFSIFFTMLSQSLLITCSVYFAKWRNIHISLTILHEIDIRKANNPRMCKVPTDKTLIGEHLKEVSHWT